MKIQDLMQAAPSTCQPWDQLDGVVQKMWSADLGWMPVVDDQDRLVGVVTDRDTCMHASTSGRPLGDLLVKGCMQNEVLTCAGSESVEAGLERLSAGQVHRLPVVDAEKRVVGVFTLGDVARAWRQETQGAMKSNLGAKAWEAVAAIMCPPSEACKTNKPAKASVIKPVPAKTSPKAPTPKAAAPASVAPKPAPKAAQKPSTGASAKSTPARPAAPNSDTKKAAGKKGSRKG